MAPGYSPSVVALRTNRLIISGGIGAGKSMAAALLADHGARVIDADAVGHQVIAGDGAAYEAVAGRWPEVVVDGAIDRRALGRIVFSDPLQLQELEAMTHPAIARRITEMFGDDQGVVAVEMPILEPILGEGWLRVVVDAPDDTRWARLRGRGLDDEEIAARMASQPSREDWLQAADYVLDNSGTVEELEAEVERLWESVESGPPPR